MNDDIDYDPRLATQLAAALETRPLGRRLTPRPRSSRAGAAFALGATLLIVGAGGLAFEVNAVAESNGAGCLDALAKIYMFGRTIAETKAQVLAYADRMIAENCQGVDPGLLQKTNNGTNPLPTPSATGPLKSPGYPYASGGAPKPSGRPANLPGPSTTARP